MLHAVVVCPSVCLSHAAIVPKCMTKRRMTQTTPYDSPGTLVFRCHRSRRNSNRVISTGAPNSGGVGSDRRFSTNISLINNIWPEERTKERTDGLTGQRDGACPRGDGGRFSRCLVSPSVRCFVRSYGQILLTRYLMSALNIFDKTDGVYSLAPLIIWFDSGGQTSKVKVTARRLGQILSTPSHELLQKSRWNLQGITVSLYW